MHKQFAENKVSFRWKVFAAKGRRRQRFTGRMVQWQVAWTLHANIHRRMLARCNDGSTAEAFKVQDDKGAKSQYTNDDWV